MFAKVAFSDMPSYLPADAILLSHNADAGISGIKHFSKDDLNPSDNYLYICSYDDYRNHAHAYIQNAIVCAADSAAADKLVTRKNLIVVFSQEDLYMVTTSILNDLSAGARIGAAGITLQQHSLGKMPVEAIMEYAYQEIGNPIALTDSNFRITAKVGFDTIENEPQWTFAESNGAMPPDFAGTLKRIKGDDSDLLSNQNNVIDDKILLNTVHRQATAKLVIGGKITGYLMVLENNHTFSEFDLEFIPMVANQLALCVRQDDGNLLMSSSFAEDFLASILNENLTSPDEIMLRQETFGLKLKHTLFLISIDLPLAVMDSDRTHTFVRKLKKLLKTELIIPFENSIVILGDTDEMKYIGPEISQEDFEALLAEFGCKANVSAPFHDLYQTRRHYMQNKMCTTMRNMLHIEDAIIFYQKDIAEYHMIFNYSMHQNLDNLLHPAVLRLRESDKENGTERLDTLFAYTDHLCNLRTTAKDLYLHYNTLKYRIDKIVALTGIDFDNPAEVYRISLSKKVLQIEEAIKERG
ncbi:MAG: helix-turn-helix domain-containing protein [Firmicutes bacterium]|nr:helix-turn-helix domain-containing protein [Bacillota bacterium]